jgi:hypothetical protein
MKVIPETCCAHLVGYLHLILFLYVFLHCFILYTQIEGNSFVNNIFSEEDLEVVNKTTTRKRHNIWYEARLLTDNADSSEKAKRVYVYISPKVKFMSFFLQIVFVSLSIPL